MTLMVKRPGSEKKDLLRCLFICDFYFFQQLSKTMSVSGNLKEFVTESAEIPYLNGVSTLPFKTQH